MYNEQNGYVPHKKRTKRSLKDHRMRTRYSSRNVVTCFVVDRSQFRSNVHQRIYTGYLQDAERHLVIPRVAIRYLKGRYDKTFTGEDVERMRTGQTAREPDKPLTNA